VFYIFQQEQPLCFLSHFRLVLARDGDGCYGIASIKRELLGRGRTRKSKQAGFGSGSSAGWGACPFVHSCSLVLLYHYRLCLLSFVTLGGSQEYGRRRGKVEEWLPVGMLAFRYLASSRPS